MIRIAMLTFAMALLLAGCGGGSEPEQAGVAATGPEGAKVSAQPRAGPARSEAEALEFPDLETDIWTLSSDEFEGRRPGTQGEERAVKYIAARFREAGLAPGNGNSYFQQVPLVGITPDHSATLAIRGRGYKRDLKYGSEMMVWSKRVTEDVSVDRSDMVFVGYGIVAPEYQWNDYAGVDVEGKTVVMLVNDPGYATGDSDLFRGKTMTYYGRWTYKYEEAARQGAAAAIIVHEEGAAGYGWDVVSSSWANVQFDLVTEDRNMQRAAAEGWITGAVAKELVAAAGADLGKLSTAAASREFKARPLGLTMSVAMHAPIKESTSRNVLGALRGTKRPDDYILYMAHWDHLGKDDSLDGDQIYNGAVDNASGVAALISLAEAFNAITPAPERSLLFLSVTAEEAGLLGSEYYGTHPTVPLENIAAGINMDGLNIYGPMKDVVVIGYRSSELEDYLAEFAKGQRRYVTQEPTPEKGFFYRSDHFNLAKLGVPMLYAKSGVDSREHGREWGLQQQASWTAKHYHQPSDEFSPSWDLSGAREDLRLYFEIGQRIASETAWPNWYEGTEFRAIRDRSRAK